MRSLFTFVLLSLTCVSFAQKIRFSDHDNVWVSTGAAAEGCIYTLTLSYGADTMIAGKVYEPFVTNVFNQISSGCTPWYPYEHYFIREDTTAGILYYRDVNRDTIEHVYFNYHMHAGDTIDFDPGYLTPRDSVTAVDSTIINGVYHKVFYMTTRGYTMCTYTFVEGIGSLESPFIPLSTGCFEAYQNLVCFSKTTVPGRIAIDLPISAWSHTDSFHNCHTLSTGNSVQQLTRVLIAPNPANDRIDIASSEHFDNYTTISVFDATGRCVYNSRPGSQSNRLAINVSAWSEGVYVVTVANENGVVKREKVIVVR